MKAKEKPEAALRTALNLVSWAKGLSQRVRGPPSKVLARLSISQLLQYLAAGPVSKGRAKKSGVVR